MTRRIHKGGRPKQPKPDSFGTPEQQAMRIALVGNAQDQRASRPLGVLEARGFLTAEQVAVADNYASLYRAAIGRKANGDRGVGGMDDDRLERMTQAYNASRSALIRIGGSRVKDALENVAIYERVPNFLLVVLGKRPPRPSDATEWKNLLTAIEILSEGLNGQRRAA